MSRKKQTDAHISVGARRYINRHFHIIFQRMVYVLLFASIQIAVLIWLFVRMHTWIPYFFVLCMVLSLLAAIHIINKNSNPAIKIAWLIPLFTLPIFGGLLYLMFGGHHKNRRLNDAGVNMRTQYEMMQGDALPHGAIRTQDDAAMALHGRDAALISHYIKYASGCPPIGNTATDYYPTGEAMFAALCEALARAERYIFLEYFIIEEGTFWNTVLDILTERAAAGVEVRVMYDDFGSMLTLPIASFSRMRSRVLRQQRLRECLPLR